MFRHLLKLIWKRKTRNVMLSLEILLAFVIVFAIAGFAARSYQLYRLPVGFSYTDVWSVTVQAAQSQDAKVGAAVYDNFKRSLEAMPEVERVSYATFSPYRSARSSSSFMNLAGGRKMDTDLLEVGDDFFAATGMALAEGHWFSTADDGAAATPVILNRRAAQTLFPGESALGKVFGNRTDIPTKRDRYRITGIVDEFRNRGEFMVPVNFMLLRFNPADDQGGRPKSIILKLKPGTPRSFEVKLNQQLKLVRSDWSYEVAPLADLRASQMRSQLIPLMIAAVIGAFLLLMVGFGLFGVLWQNTTRRIPEIGLRRAIGANAGDIYRQIIAEQMLLSSVAMAVALLMLVQLPLTGVFGQSLNWVVFAQAVGLSMGVIYLISLLCSLYPGWRASRLSPTEALHYE